MTPLLLYSFSRNLSDKSTPRATGGTRKPPLFLKSFTPGLSSSEALAGSQNLLFPTVRETADVTQPRNPSLAHIPKSTGQYH